MPCTPDCGACCDPVTLADASVEAIFDPELDPALSPQGALLRDIWEPLGPLRGYPGFTALRCLHYDVESRLCGIYESRPPVCREYPFYNREPNFEDMDGPRDRICGYQAEVGRKVLPIVAVRQHG